MHISEDLPQFPTEKALLIVTATFHAEFYEAFEGEIEKIDSLEVERPAYSDKEGRFGSRGDGRVFGAGSVLEDTGDHDHKEFLVKMEEKLSDMLRDRKPDIVFLFAPEHSAPEVRELVPNEFQDRVLGVFKGNYSSQKPFELLKKIQKLEDERVPEPKSEDAQKLYDKPHQRHQE